MSKEKQSQSETFSANPFKQLKGFAVSSPTSEKMPQKQTQRTTSKPDDIDPPILSFSDEMAKIGMDKVFKDRSEPVRQSEPPASEPAPAKPRTEEELFLSAIGRMDSVFKDELPVEESAGSTPRRMKQVRQGRLQPEATLDLHGLNRIEAREKVGFFLQDAQYQGKKTVLIITGKGHGSDGEPVLRKDTELFLNEEARAWVSEWGRAPRQYGGNGALVVFIRQLKEG